MIAAVRRHVEEVFDGQAAIFLAGEDGNRSRSAAGRGRLVREDPKETAVAQWVHEHCRAGRARAPSTLAGAAALYLPLVGSRGPVGVLAVGSPPGTGRARHRCRCTCSRRSPTRRRSRSSARSWRGRRTGSVSRPRARSCATRCSRRSRTTCARRSPRSPARPAAWPRATTGSIPPRERELVLTIHEEARADEPAGEQPARHGPAPGARRSRCARSGSRSRRCSAPRSHQLERQLKEREVVLRVPDDLPLVAIDDVLIERVLVNLLENALRYTPPGSPIEVAASARPGEVTVEVLDRGPGPRAGGGASDLREVLPRRGGALAPRRRTRARRRARDRRGPRRAGSGPRTARAAARRSASPCRSPGEPPVGGRPAARDRRRGVSDPVPVVLLDRGRSADPPLPARDPAGARAIDLARSRDGRGGPRAGRDAHAGGRPARSGSARLDGLEVTRRLREWSSVADHRALRARARAGQGRGARRRRRRLPDEAVRRRGAAGAPAGRAATPRGRAATGPAEPVFTTGELARRPGGARRCASADSEVHLTPTEFKLLALLVRHAGKVVTHRQLLVEVWGPGAAANTHYLRVQMHGLRHKLEETPARPRYLITEPGVGYRLRDEG